jgi:hypothetical protein
MTFLSGLNRNLLLILGREVADDHVGELQDIATVERD